MASEGYHEASLSEETRDMHRAITSLMEELEAVDWYQQRVDATKNEELAAILAHNRDEEIEHAMMVLEWIRRRNPKFDVNAKTYLFSEGPVTEVEEAKKEGGGEAGAAEAEAKPDVEWGCLSIGSLKASTKGGRK